MTRKWSVKMGRHLKQHGKNPDLRAKKITNQCNYSLIDSSPANPHHHRNPGICSFTLKGNSSLCIFMPVHLCSHLVSFHVIRQQREGYRAQREKQQCSKAFVVQSNHSFTQHLTLFLEPFQHQAERERERGGEHITHLSKDKPSTLTPSSHGAKNIQKSITETGLGTTVHCVYSNMHAFFTF